MPKPEDSQYICWIDLETTGNRDIDQIIEIGAVMTDRDLNELSSKQIVISGPMIFKNGVVFMGSKPELYSIDPVVVEMHTKNGLLVDCRNSDNTTLSADLEMVEWIKQYTSGDHIPLAGSGVSHFDRRYIRKDLPKFEKFLSYWAYDTGIIRRTLKLFGIDASAADTTDDKTHRALDDIRAHVEEMRRYKKMFTELVQVSVYDAIRRAWPG